MVDAFTVDPDALDKDATTWRDWKSDLEKISDGIPISGSDFDPLAFSILPGASDVRNAYDSVTNALKQSIDVGIAQFDGFNQKLTKVATLYREAERANVEAIASTDEEVGAP